VGILSALSRLLIGPHGFRIPVRNSPIQQCRIRLMSESDISDCERVYLANEAQHFPADFFESFAAWLRADDSLKIVADIDGKVVGLGGVALRSSEWGEAAVIEFGMVHPDHSRRGIGTALLLARIAAIPATTIPCKVLMSSAGETVAFYRRFGFAYVTDAWVNDSLLSHYVVTISFDNYTQCREALPSYALLGDDILGRSNDQFPRRFAKPQ